jgi:hypothetical protein
VPHKNGESIEVISPRVLGNSDLRRVEALLATTPETLKTTQAMAEPAGEKYAQPRPSLQAETMGRQSDAAAHFPPKEHNGPRVHYGLSLLIRSIGPFVPDFLRNYRCTGRLRST